MNHMILRLLNILIICTLMIACDDYDDVPTIGGETIGGESAGGETAGDESNEFNRGVVSSRVISPTNSGCALGFLEDQLWLSDCDTHQLHHLQLDGTEVAQYGLPLQENVIDMTTMPNAVLILFESGSLWHFDVESEQFTDTEAGTPDMSGIAFDGEHLYSWQGNSVYRRDPSNYTTGLRLSASNSINATTYSADRFFTVSDVKSRGIYFQSKIDSFKFDTATTIDKASSFYVDIDASIIKGIASDGDTLWLLGAGVGEDSGKIVEARLERGPEIEQTEIELSCDNNLCVDRFTIDNDSNRDGELSPGETARIRLIEHRNTGSSDILGLTGTISTDSPHVSFIAGTDLSFIPTSYRGQGVCPSGDSCERQVDIDFVVSVETPPNTIITFNLNLIDSLGNEYLLAHDVRVIASDINLSISSFTINRDSNNDEVLSPGETARIDGFSVQNSGSSDALNLTGTISTDSPYVSFQDGQDLTFDLGTCSQMRSCSVSNDFDFTIDVTTPFNTIIIFNLNLIDEYGTEYNLLYEIRVVDDDVNLTIDRFTIDNDSNRDGELNPGETARIRLIRHRNTGSSDILGLTGTISTDSPHVSFIAGTDLSFIPTSYRGQGVCPSGDSCERQVDIDFVVSVETPPNTIITFNLNLIDSLGNEYLLAHDVRVIASDINLSISSFTINRDSNNDGFLSPGETARVDGFSVQNSGSSDALNLTGTISTDSPYVSFQDGQDLTFNLGTCSQMRSCSVSNDFDFTIDVTTPFNTIIIFNLNLIDEYGTEYNLLYETRVVDDDVNLTLDRFTIDNDSNRDGELNPGETARIRLIRHRNTGSSDILGLTGTISTDSPHVSFMAGTDLSFIPTSYRGQGVCPSGDSCERQVNINFTVSQTAPIGHTFSFIMELNDSYNNTFRLEHEVTIQ